MSYYSNGFVDSATIELRSSPDATNSLNHIMTGMLKFGGDAYTVSGTVSEI